MSIFDSMSTGSYEQVVYCHDRGTGLRSIIVIHDTTLGPALGGVRMWPYPDESAALKDCMDLAKAMTLKASVAGLNLGGGKSVIIGDPQTEKTEAILRAHGRFIQSLGGRYIPGIDIGTEAEDMLVIAREAERVSCETGDPSFYTALGVVASMRAALRSLDGDGSLRGRKVAIQGVGHVGSRLARLLHEEGVSVVVSDVLPERASSIADELGVEVEDPEAILRAPCDILSPCALGGVIDQKTIGTLQCRAVVGGANNPLADWSLADRLDEHGILFVPDFVANGGGLIYLEEGLLGHDDPTTRKRVETIGNTVDTIIERSKARGSTTIETAVQLAEARIEAMRQVGPAYVGRQGWR